MKKLIMKISTREVLDYLSIFIKIICDWKRIDYRMMFAECWDSDILKVAWIQLLRIELNRIEAKANPASGNTMVSISEKSVIARAYSAKSLNRLSA